MSGPFATLVEKEIALVERVLRREALAMWGRDQPTLAVALADWADQPALH